VSKEKIKDFQSELKKIPNWFIQEMIEDLPGDSAVEDFKIVYVTGIKHGRKETSKQFEQKIKELEKEIERLKKENEELADYTNTVDYLKTMDLVKELKSKLNLQNKELDNDENATFTTPKGTTWWHGNAVKKYFIERKKIEDRIEKFRKDLNESFEIQINFLKQRKSKSPKKIMSNIDQVKRLAYNKPRINKRIDKLKQNLLKDDDNEQET